MIYENVDPCSVIAANAGSGALGDLSDFLQVGRFAAAAQRDLVHDATFAREDERVLRYAARALALERFRRLDLDGVCSVTRGVHGDRVLFASENVVPSPSSFPPAMLRSAHSTYAGAAAMLAFASASLANTVTTSEKAGRLTVEQEVVANSAASDTGLCCAPARIGERSQFVVRLLPLEIVLGDVVPRDQHRLSERVLVSSAGRRGRHAGRAGTRGRRPCVRGRSAACSEGKQEGEGH